MILIRNALASIKAYKLRVAMAMIWIILGVTSVVVVSSVSNGLDKEINDITTSSKNRNGIISFWPNDYNITDVALVFQPFSNKEIEVVSLMEGVQSVVPSDGQDNSFSGSYGTEILIDNKRSYAQFEAVSEEAEVNIISGRFFGYGEEERRVILLSEESSLELFDGPLEAIGKTINLNENYYEIIGVISMKEQERQGIFQMGGGYSTSYMPKETFKNFIGQDNYYMEPKEAINVKVSPGFDKNEVLNKVVTKLNEIKGDKDGEYNLQWDQSSTEELSYIKDSIGKFTGIITYILLGIGGIGIMNVMYMSVVERKREIGIRRAIGAKPSSILLQFIIESAIITSIGGVLGIVVGIIGANYASTKLPFDAVVSSISCFYAVILAVITGIIFGLIPAFKASKLDPIRAIQG